MNDDLIGPLMIDQSIHQIERSTNLNCPRQIIIHRSSLIDA